MITIEEIQQLLPHRYPMLLLDKVDAVHLGESAVGIKNVTINEPFFPGHFPVKPLMPGVLIIEAMAQTAAVLVLKTLNVSSNNSLVYFMSVIEAKFRKPVVPGDTLRLHVEKIQNRGNVWRFKGQAKVEGDLHAEAIFTAMIVEK